MKCFAIVLLSITLAGCSTYTVVYDSVPQSAQVICNGRVRGITPLPLNYDLKDEVRNTGSFVGEDCYARWISGANAHYSQLIPIFSNGTRTTVNRAPGPGLQEDIYYDAQIQARKQQQQLIDAMTAPRTTNTDCWRDMFGNQHCSSTSF